MNSPELVREPIYQQVNTLLRNLIGSAEFGVGRRFLTEREISQRFGVSRPTANKALASLVSEGLLEFRRGVGTFVIGRKLDYNLRALVSFTDEALAAGKRPSTVVLSLKSEAAGSGIAEALRLAADERVWAVARLRLADGLPVILERRWIRAGVGPELTKNDLSGSVYAAWLRAGLEIEGADQRIRAVSIGRKDAQSLKVRERSAGLLVVSTGYLRGGTPLWYERTLYRGDAYEFHNRLGGIQPAGIPGGSFLDVTTAGSNS
jgi:GntR family transcriptional regulator